jgi:hypothetical protein
VIVDAIRADRAAGRLSLEETVADLAELTRQVRARGRVDDSLAARQRSWPARRRLRRMAPNLGWRRHGGDNRRLRSLCGRQRV